MLRRIIFLIIATLLLSQCRTEMLTEDGPAVGEITFDPNIDNPDFYLCRPHRILPYYQVRTAYEGGNRAIKDFMLAHYIWKDSFAEENGFITIKFVVNCQGETDRFRILQIDRNYQDKEFPKALTEQLLNLTKELDRWVPGEKNDQKYDTYYYLNFKIVNGKIAEILP